MVFKTTGNKSGPVVLLFHAMGVTGESSMPVADKMVGKFYIAAGDLSYSCENSGTIISILRSKNGYSNIRKYLYTSMQKR